MILFCYGTRPEYIKIKKLIELYNKPYKILFVSQHENLVLGEYDYKININNQLNNRLDDIVSSVFLNFKPEYLNGVTHMLVQGDTATAFSLSLLGFHNNIKIIHLEAGLRTYDKHNPYPEETYRQLISRISDINFCPTTNNLTNLLNEKTESKNFVVGNTVLDNLTKEGTENGNTVIVTLHRRENHPIIHKWFHEINELAKENSDIKFVLPIHPNPNVSKHRDILTHVNVINSMGHDDFINELKKCKIIISDSGGIQEEASFLNKKVIVCRQTTERTESLNKTSFLCNNPIYLKEMFYNIIKYENTNYECPFGDGKSSEKIIEILGEIL